MATATSIGMASLDKLTVAQLTMIERDMLLRAEPELQYTRFAYVRPFAEREGYTDTFTRMTALSAATTALTEGVTPSGESTTLTTVTVTPDYYGSWAKITEKMQQMGVFAIVDDLSDNLGYQAGKTADVLARTVLVAGGTTQIADGVASEDVVAATNILELDEIFNAVRQLMKNNARPLAEIGNRYACIYHPDAWYDLWRDAEIKALGIHALPPGEQNPMFGTAMFDVANVRFFQSSNAYINTDGGAGSVDTYHSLVLGRQSYAIVGLTGQIQPWQEGGTDVEIRPIQLIVHGKEDYPPMDLYSTVAWKINQGQVVLNANFIIDIIHACSKGSNA